MDDYEVQDRTADTAKEIYDYVVAPYLKSNQIEYIYSFDSKNKTVVFEI